MHSANVLKGGSVIVVGDVMLDMYVSGNAWRISPEAPVPVVAVNQKTCTLGGAGNVALNLARLGCDVRLFGARGNDAMGNLVEDLLRDNQIINHLEVDNDLPTTTKTRVMANNQQLVRFDEEGKFNGHHNGRYSQMTVRVIEAIVSNDVKVVVLSDYNKGILSADMLVRIIGYCRGSGIHVFIDPKLSDWCHYSGATLIKPNLKELRDSSGNQKLETYDQVGPVAMRMLEAYKLGAVLVTMGDRGMVLCTGAGYEVVQATAKEVFDVSGAGDTVLATMAAFVANGMSLSEAARLANVAAGIVVGRLGTATVAMVDLEPFL